MSSAASLELNFSTQDSNHCACAALRQQRFLQRTIERLDSEPAVVVAELLACRDAFLQAGNMIIHVAGDLTNEKNIWRDLVTGLQPPSYDSQLLEKPTNPQSLLFRIKSWPAPAASVMSPADSQSANLLSETGRNPSGESIVLGLSAIDNAFMKCTGTFSLLYFSQAT